MKSERPSARTTLRERREQLGSSPASFSVLAAWKDTLRFRAVVPFLFLVLALGLSGCRVVKGPMLPFVPGALEGKKADLSIVERDAFQDARAEQDEWMSGHTPGSITGKRWRTP